MNKKSPVPAYRLLSKPSNKLKLFINHYESPCNTCLHDLLFYPSCSNDMEDLIPLRHNFYHSLLLVIYYIDTIDLVTNRNTLKRHDYLKIHFLLK